MTTYSVVLFLHLLCVLVLVVALSFEALSLARLRRSSTISEMHLWIDLVPRLPAMALGSLIVLLLSGGYLTARLSAWELGWPKAAIAAMVLIAPFGAMTGKRMGGIRRLIAGQNRVDAALLARVQDPFLMFSLQLRIWGVAGIVLLMAAKPAWAGSAAIIALSLIAALVTAIALLRRVHDSGTRTRSEDPVLTP